MKNKFYKILILLISFLIKNISLAQIKECSIGNYCSGAIECSIHGNCNYDIYELYNDLVTDENLKNPKCECHKGYLTVGTGIHCCYKQKSQTTGFFLELFISFGAGHFYFGNYVYAIIKLIFELAIIILCCIFSHIACHKENKEINENEIDPNKYIENMKCSLPLKIIIITTGIILVMQFIDLLLIGLSVFKDGNGQELLSW